MSILLLKKTHTKKPFPRLWRTCISILVRLASRFIFENTNCSAYIYLLVQEEIITCDCNPVDYKEKAERKSTKMRCSRRKIIEQVPNRRIKEVKFDRDDFADFKSLMDDSIPFPDSFFILEDETDHGEGATNAANATSASNSVNVDDSDGCD